MSDWMSGTVSEGMHRFPVRVYFEDTDTAQMVYHANYLRYMERARTELLRLVGVSQYVAMRGDVGSVLGFAVKNCHVEFRAPARLDDLLQVRTVNNGVGAAYIDFGQDIWRNDTPIAEARIRVVCLDGKGKPRRQPTDLIARLKTMLPPRDTAKA
ncbi:YbgC/FadM family acyl-CoA thioesterase [Emcibacter sp. SYSU 3D8]|uniref:YbgC/FadM family acyl-CoA thioesterase n=1 Tax=Emcibacter sp. SYSU 3D8 TaxID=3133969 RepID=UPI0031FEBD97